MSANDTAPRRFKISRDFREQVQTLAVTPRLSCQLNKKLSCCGGQGYRVEARGAVAFARICECVSSCSACLGRARLMEGNDSRPCQTPPPNVVVNLINAANIPARYAHASLDRFSNFTGNARQVISGFRNLNLRPEAGKVTGLIIEGPVGVGKTYILAAMAKSFAEKGLSVRFTDFFQLLGELKAGFTLGKADATQLAPLVNVDVLLIDELGKGRNNDFELTILDQLICGRYNQNKPIIASTNYHLATRHYHLQRDLDSDREPSNSSEMATDQFSSLEQRIGPRMYSRLAEMCQFVELRGEDFRRRELRQGIRS